MGPRKAVETARAVLVLAARLNGIGVVRSLSSSGIRCIVVCNSEDDPAFLSNMPIQKLLLKQDLPVCDQITTIIYQLNDQLLCVIPTSDEYAEVLANLRADLNVSVPLIIPPDHLVAALNDKRNELELVKRLGIRIPESKTTPNEIESSIDGLRMPVIVKPRSHREAHEFGAKNRVFRERHKYKRFIESCNETLSDIVVQEVIEGDEKCLWVCHAVFDQRSEMVSAFTFRRIGTRPYLYGITTIASSEDNIEVKATCGRIGRAMGYVGPAMFEFKQDPGSGLLYYIETNPRLGLCNWFDTSCGVPTVFNAVAVCTGSMAPKLGNKQRPGTYVNVLADVAARRKAGVAWWQIVRVYWKGIRRPLVLPVWQFKDPLPAFIGVFQFLSKGRAHKILCRRSTGRRQ